MATKKQTLTYSEYCFNRMWRINSGGKTINGQRVFVLENGKTFTEQEMDEIFPIHLPLVSANEKKLKGENPDKSKNFLHNSKSY